MSGGDAFEARLRRALRDGEPGGPGAMHACPVTGCPAAPLPRAILMCPPHWRMVPKKLQRAVYAAYAGGRGLGTTVLHRAQDDAVAAVLAHLHPETTNGEDHA